MRRPVHRGVACRVDSALRHALQELMQLEPALLALTIPFDGGHTRLESHVDPDRAKPLHEPADEIRIERLEQTFASLEPPNGRLSTTATFHPALRQISAAPDAPVPVPIATRSYCLVILAFRVHLTPGDGKRTRSPSPKRIRLEQAGVGRDARSGARTRPGTAYASRYQPHARADCSASRLAHPTRSRHS